MVKHILLFKLKQSPPRGTKEENAREMKKQIEALKRKIPCIINIEVGINTGKSENAWDCSLYSEFENFADLAHYREHPEHIKVVGLVNEVCEQRCVVDYEV
ncbi:MAG: Dabb family protein [Candidatus Goldiibacteriota bacterium]